MSRIILLCLCLSVSQLIFSQKKALNDFTFVVVPLDYEFTNKSDQFKLNSMTKFYLEKAGFNAFFSNETPNAEKCDGLYADVEKLPAFMSNKMQLVLRDCDGQEIYRSPEGKSRLKEYEVSYQDALRKALSGLGAMRVQQKNPKIKNIDVETHQITKIMATSDTATEETISKTNNSLPSANFSSFSLNGERFLLQKSDEGFSLYKESNDLLLVGKLVVLGEIVKYMDTKGKVSNVHFDQNGSMVIENEQMKTTYKLEN